MKRVFLSLLAVFIILFSLIVITYIPFASATEGIAITGYSVPDTALLIIDIQKDMTEKSGKKPFNIAQTDSMIPVVNKLIETAKIKNWPVVYITHQFKKNSLLRIVTRDFLLEGKPGTEMDSRILSINQNHFTKNRMDAFSSFKLDSFLCQNEITHLLITGIAAEQCVDRTCQGALNRGYKTTIISDAIAGHSDRSRIKKLKDYEKYGAQIINADKLINKM